MPRSKSTKWREIASANNRIGNIPTYPNRNSATLQIDASPSPIDAPQVINRFQIRHLFTSSD